MSVDRGFTWMDDETVALIDIFSKPDVQSELRGAKRNIVVYERIAQELSDIGFSRTAYQCREKIKRLRKEYQHTKYCVQNNSTPKKPMKHFELVDKIFNRNPPLHNSGSELNLLSSENEEDMHSSLNIDPESDASNSFTENEYVAPDSILPDPTCLAALDSENSNILLEIKLTSSPLNTQTNSDNTLFLNNEENYDLGEKDSPLDDDYPWVPNVVLVENDPENNDAESTSENADNNEDVRLQDFTSSPAKETVDKDSDEPQPKKRKHESTQHWLKHVLDNVAESFFKFQESSESRFLDRITHLEQERMKRDESMQKLWLEFEERRRKEEQQHELKMFSLLGQFISQMNDTSKCEET